MPNSLEVSHRQAKMRRCAERAMTERRRALEQMRLLVARGLIEPTGAFRLQPKRPMRPPCRRLKHRLDQWGEFDARNFATEPQA
jgi:hypothetical protein